MTTTVPRGQARESMRSLIGCNLRPGMVRGGFSRPFSGNSKNPDKRRQRARLGFASHEIKEAARVVLEKRPMPRATQSHVLPNPEPADSVAPEHPLHDTGHAESGAA